MDLSLEVLDRGSADAYVSARKKWMEIITGNLPPRNSSTIPYDRNRCFNDLPTVIDDTHICGRDVKIDGPGSVLGQAGPSWVRVSLDANGAFEAATTITGNMQFDFEDIAFLIGLGLWEDVIFHEMGHVMGFGSLWALLGLTDVALNYLGAAAINIWNNEWGCIGTPPVETDGGPGRAGGHWDEECLVNELMTGFINLEGNPLSALTIASMKDVGYEVDYSVAGNYDGSDTTCCNGAPILSPDQPGKPELSATGRAQAVTYGKQVLSLNQRPPKVAGIGKEEDGLIYVGDKFTTVLFEENGILYDVFVTNE